MQPHCTVEPAGHTSQQWRAGPRSDQSEHTTWPTGRALNLRAAHHDGRSLRRALPQVRNALQAPPAGGQPHGMRPEILGWPVVEGARVHRNTLYATLSNQELGRFRVKPWKVHHPAIIRVAEHLGRDMAIPA